MGLLTDHRRQVLGAVLGAAATLFAVAARAQPAATELSIKTAFVYKFGEFITWPAPMMGADTFQICSIGDPAAAAVLAEIAKSEWVGGRRVAVRVLTGVNEADGCHVLYIGGAAPLDGAALQALARRPILTVADTQRSENEPAVIRFVIRDNRVRFVIDDQLAADNQLTISSRLLAVALTVRRRGREQ